MAEWRCKTGDYHRQIALELSDMTTSGATGVTFRMRLASGGALVVNSAGTIESSSKIRYQFTGTQLDTPGHYLLEATLTYPDGQETAPSSGQVDVIIESRLS